MRRLLWIGDAVAATGFARCTHKTLDELRKTWEVFVLGINYHGDPHSYPYRIYPCAPGGDAFGIYRTRWLVEAVKPEVIVIQNDPWNVPAYLEQIAAADVPVRPLVVASMPVDGKNCSAADKINALDLGIFWTEFGKREAVAGGFVRPAEVIPLGVDLDAYKPVDQRAAREALGIFQAGLPEDAFIVGNVNRNQPRKRLDLTVRYFTKWAKQPEVKNAFLFLQLCPTGEAAFEPQQLMHYYGFRCAPSCSENGHSSECCKRLIYMKPPIWTGYPEDKLPLIYSAFDVQMSTTQGEGWGLTAMEGMACGVPFIGPDWSALGEWAAPASYLVPCTSTYVTPNGINVLGGIADEAMFIQGLDFLYQTRSWSEDSRGWARLRKKGLELVARPEYRWEAIGKRFAEAIEKLVAARPKTEEVAV